MRLGRTDLTVSPIGLGADHFGTTINQEDSFAILDAFLDAGGNFIDTAHVYGAWIKGAGNRSEQVIGKWLAKRDHRHLIVATKGGHYDLHAPSLPRLSKAEIWQDMEMSLRTLGLDCLPLYWLHRDDLTRPIEEIIETMEAFKKAGYIMHYGASNYTAKRLYQALAFANACGVEGFVAVSNQYSPLKLNAGQNTNQDPTLVLTGEDELRFHEQTKTPLVPFQFTGKGYFSKLSQNLPISPALVRAYQNPHNERLYQDYKEKAELMCCSMQTITLSTMPKLCPFPLIPLTSVKRTEDMADIAEAIDILSR